MCEKGQNYILLLSLEQNVLKIEINNKAVKMNRNYLTNHASSKAVWNVFIIRLAVEGQAI
jgi:hypothetical protein